MKHLLTWIYFGLWWVVVRILWLSVGGGGWWWVVVDIFWLLLGGGGWWQIYFGWCWVVVGGGRYILAGGRRWWVLVDIFWLVVGGSGWWRVVAQFSLTQVYSRTTTLISILSCNLEPHVILHGKVMWMLKKPKIGSGAHYVCNGFMKRALNSDFLTN